MDDTLRPVAKEITCAITMIPIADNNPASPTIIGSRRYIITPRIVSMEGVKTPEKVPNLFDRII
jgi:hypothetical protein